jgi:hypothetical protein
LRRKNLKRPLRETGRRVSLLDGLEYRRIFYEAPDEKDEQCGEQADPKQGPPGNVLREQGEQHRREDGSNCPTDGPPALDRAHGFATVFRTDNLTHQDSARCPFAAEAKTH